MMEFRDLDSNERYEMLDKALQFYRKRETAIHLAATKADTITPPIDEQLFRPEAWKASHWKWFIKLLHVDSKVNSGVVISRRNKPVKVDC